MDTLHFPHKTYRFTAIVERLAASVVHGPDGRHLQCHRQCHLPSLLAPLLELGRFACVVRRWIGPVRWWGSDCALGAIPCWRV